MQFYDSILYVLWEIIQYLINKLNNMIGRTVFIFAFFIHAVYALNLEEYRSDIAKILNVENDAITFLDRDKASNRWFRIRANGKVYYLRVFISNCAKFWKKNEIKLVKKLDQEGLTAKYVGCADDYKCYIVEDAGASVKMHRLNDEILEKIAIKLRKLHDFSYNQKAYGYKNIFRICMKYSVYVPVNFGTLSTEWLKYHSAVATSSNFCHNSLSCSNIRICNGDVVFICWHTAGLGDKYDDIGRIIAEYNLSDTQSTIFLQAYFGRSSTNYEIKQIKRAITMSYLLIAADHLQHAKEADDKYCKLADTAINKYIDMFCKTNSIKRMSKVEEIANNIKLFAKRLYFLISKMLH